MFATCVLKRRKPTAWFFAETVAEPHCPNAIVGVGVTSPYLSGAEFLKERILGTPVVVTRGRTSADHGIQLGSGPFRSR